MMLTPENEEMLANLLKPKPLDCEKVAGIADIHDHYFFKDQHPNGTRDKKLVSCGQRKDQQNKGYDELQDIYDEHLEVHVKYGRFTRQFAIKALCECCAETSAPRVRTKFYECLNKKLGIELIP